MEPMELEIGEKLKSIRNSHILSLDDAAALTRVSKPMLGQIERGQSIPTVTTLWKIAAGLKMPLSFFLERQQAECAVVSPDKAHVIVGDGGKMRAYPLFTYDPVRSMETFCRSQCTWRSRNNHFKGSIWCGFSYRTTKSTFY